MKNNQPQCGAMPPSRSQLSSLIVLTMRRILLYLVLVPLLLNSQLATFNAVIRQEDSITYLDLEVDIETGGHLYADTFAVDFPAGLTASLARPISTKPDEESESQIMVGRQTISYILESPIPAGALTLTIRWQGCRGDLCLMPQTTSIPLNGKAGSPISPPAPNPPATDLLQGMEVAASASGYLSPGQFLAFCKKAEASLPEKDNLLVAASRRYGIWLALLLLLPLGAMLNLTPCILPMIPINLAIIGATGDGISRGKGVLNGGLYGLGMALSYGLLGIFTVLTGAQFGSLNHSPTFNLCIALLFCLLALAMLDVFRLDLARFRRTVRIGGSIGAFVMGCISAILAGACVAPVLIWALLLATSQYSQGNPAGLLIPFGLGIGMALPWPLLAIGVTRMPRPGAWMITVRRLFALLIFIFAIYYGMVAYRILKKGDPSEPLPGWCATYEEAYNLAVTRRTPLLLVFSGRACKACDAMHATTFRDKTVKAAIDGWSKVILLADDPEDKTAFCLVSHLQLIGTPTCYILKPTQKD